MVFSWKFTRYVKICCLSFAIFVTQPLRLWSKIGSSVEISHYIQPSNLSSALNNTVHTGAKVRTLTNYGHCCGYHTVLFYTPLCRASSCPTFQPPPVTYYYIIHTQSDIPITSGEKSHIPTKPKGRRNLGLRQERAYWSY